MKNSKKPRLRFKGFNDDWEQRKLGELFDYERPDNYIVQSDKYNDVLSVPVLTANKAFILGYTDENRTYNQPCLIFDDFTLDCKYVDFKFMVKSSALKILSAKNNNHLYFAYERLKSENIENLGHARHYISIVQPTQTKIPNKEEQTQIGNFFYSLDNLIALHQRKYEKLTNAKKALLDKMFPKNPEKLPKIRFKGFFDAWEQRKFESLAKTRRGLTYAPSSIASHGIRVLRSSNINEDTFVLSDEDVFVCHNAVKIECVKPNDILITAANGSTRLVGKHTIIVGIRENEAIHGGFMLVASSSKPFFLNAAMSAPWYLKFINLFVAGGNGAIGNLNKNDLDNQVLLVPKNDEQDKIGAFFRNLDNLIALHQRKGEKLKNLKKALLEQMFV